MTAEISTSVSNFLDNFDVNMYQERSVNGNVYYVRPERFEGSLMSLFAIPKISEMVIEKGANEIIISACI